MKFDCSSFFKALTDETRQKIIELLEKKEMNVTEICDHFNISQPSISHHLNILKQAGLVFDKRKGKQIYYSLNKCCMCGCLTDFFSKFIKIYCSENNKKTQEKPQ